MDFLFGLNLEHHNSLKFRGSEINFIISRLLISKKSSQICYSNFKSFSNKSARFFYLSNFYIIKFNLYSPSSRLLRCSRLRPNRKSLAVLGFGAKSVEKPGWKTFLNWWPLMMIHTPSIFWHLKTKKWGSVIKSTWNKKIYVILQITKKSKTFLGSHQGVHDVVKITIMLQ